MKKVTKKEKVCKTCKQITDREEIVEICDLKGCKKILKYDHNKGYPFKIDPFLHDEGIHTEENHFCTFEHGMEWIRTTKNPLKQADDFICFYVHKRQYNTLQKIIQEGSGK